MDKTTCAFTGHRPHKFSWKNDETDPRCVELKAVLATLYLSGAKRSCTNGLCKKYTL